MSRDHTFNLNPDLQVVHYEDQKFLTTRVFSNTKNKNVFKMKGHLSFEGLTDDLFCVWSGRYCGLFSVTAEDLLLPITHDNIRVEGDEVLVDDPWPEQVFSVRALLEEAKK